MCLDAVKAYMVKNKGDTKKLKANTKWSDVIAESDKTWKGQRRVLARASQSKAVALKNMHCCHLDETSKTISLYTTAYTKVDIKKRNTWLPPGEDFGQIMWAGKNKANFMSAMLVPDYDYIIKKDRKIVTDLMKKYKKNLGPSKDFDGWNWGYQCMPAQTIITNPYTNQFQNINA